MLAKVTASGTNTAIGVGEILLLIWGETKTTVQVGVQSAVDAFKLDPIVFV